MSGVVDALQEWRARVCTALGEWELMTGGSTTSDLGDLAALIHGVADVYRNLAGKLDETGVHPLYPATLHETAEQLDGLAAHLEAALAGGEPASRPAWVQPSAIQPRQLRYIDPRDVHLNVWKHQRGGTG